MVEKQHGTAFRGSQQQIEYERDRDKCHQIRDESHGSTDRGVAVVGGGDHDRVKSKWHGIGTDQNVADVVRQSDE